MIRLRSLALALALGTSLLASCDAGARSGARTRTPDAATQAQAPLLERMRDAVDNVAHSGQRRFETHVEKAGVDQVLAYTEFVRDRGDGCFSIDPLDLQSQVDDPFLFLGLQRERQAFFRRYRDFQVRDVDLFLSNYLLRDLEQSGEVAGRSVSLLEATSRVDGRTYELSIDDETALVLAYSERRADGVLLTEMSYETFELAAGEVKCFTNSIEEEALQLRGDLKAQLGFEVWSPALVPDGYAPYSAARIRDPRGFDWFKLVFTDGVETLFFLQQSPGDPVEIERALLEAGAPAGATDDRVLVHEVGSLSVVQGSLSSREVMAVGKVASRDLLQLLDSARR